MTDAMQASGEPNIEIMNCMVGAHSSVQKLTDLEPEILNWDQADGDIN